MNQVTNQITELVQTTQSEYEKFMTWHASESRLFDSISYAQQDKIKAEIDHARALRREAIGRGERDSKDYKKLSLHIASLQSELEDMKQLSDELKQSDFDRAMAGKDLWTTHLASRQSLHQKFFNQQIADCREEVKAAASTVAPLLAKLFELEKIKERLKECLRDNLRTTTKFDGDPMVYMGIREPLPPLSLNDVLIPLMVEIVTPLVGKIDADLEPSVLTEIQRIPPIDLIDLNLVGSAARIHSQRVKRKLAEKENAVTEQQQRDRDFENWAPEAMANRAKNITPV